MTIKPIKTKHDYQEALAKVETLWDARKNTPKGDALDVLTTLIESYEEKHFSILPPDPIAAIKFRMEQLGLEQADMAPYFGGRNRVSEIFKKRRSLSIRMMRMLHKNLSIPAESLLTY